MNYCLGIHDYRQAFSTVLQQLYTAVLVVHQHLDKPQPPGLEAWLEIDLFKKGGIQPFLNNQVAQVSHCLHISIICILEQSFDSFSLQLAPLSLGDQPIQIDSDVVFHHIISGSILEAISLFSAYLGDELVATVFEAGLFDWGELHQVI